MVARRARINRATGSLRLEFICEKREGVDVGGGKHCAGGPELLVQKFRLAAAQ